MGLNQDHSNELNAALRYPRRTRHTTSFRRRSAESSDAPSCDDRSASSARDWEDRRGRRRCGCLSPRPTATWMIRSASCVQRQTSQRRAIAPAF